MDEINVIESLGALAQPTRMRTFRILVAAEPDGIAAGEIARRVGVPQNTMSAHLAILSGAGLVRGERESRSIVYRAELGRLRDVLAFFLADCCGGRPEICAPLALELSSASCSGKACP